MKVKLSLKYWETSSVSTSASMSCLCLNLAGGFKFSGLLCMLRILHGSLQVQLQGFHSFTCRLSRICLQEDNASRQNLHDLKVLCRRLFSCASVYVTETVVYQLWPSSTYAYIHCNRQFNLPYIMCSETHSRGASESMAYLSVPQQNSFQEALHRQIPGYLEMTKAFSVRCMCPVPQVQQFRYDFSRISASMNKGFSWSCSSSKTNLLCLLIRLRF